MRFTVEPSPAGGYHVRMEGSSAPLSRHDTREEAEARLAAYRRGVDQPASGDLVDLPDGSEVRLRPVTSDDFVAIEAVDLRTGAALGVARCVRTRPGVAAAAIEVIGEWQGRGLGGMLLRRLSNRATADGITTFTATLVTENRSMLRLFERLGRVQVRELGGGTLEIDVELPVADARTLLRSTATGHVRSSPSSAGGRRRVRS